MFLLLCCSEALFFFMNKSTNGSWQRITGVHLNGKHYWGEREKRTSPLSSSSLSVLVKVGNTLREAWNTWNGFKDNNYGHSWKEWMNTFETKCRDYVFINYVTFRLLLYLELHIWIIFRLYIWIIYLDYI